MTANVLTNSSYNIKSGKDKMADYVLTAVIPLKLKTTKWLPMS